jgi:RbsD/FucU transport protein family protein
MLKTLVVMILLVALSPAQTTAPASSSTSSSTSSPTSSPPSSKASSPAWRAQLTDALPLLGHRNWILVVDSAYPLQTSPGIETIETNAGHMEVVRAVLAAINRSVQVRPAVLMDAELPFVSDEDAPGVTTYRSEVTPLLRDYPLEQLPHEKIIAEIDEAGKNFRVLVLKTNMTIPYTSVFIRLDCKYWSADQEKRLRAKMAAK